jgi:phosphate transport system permease protein
MEKIMDLSPVARAAGAASAPWTRIAVKTRVAIALASVVPAALGVAVWLLSGMDFMAMLFAIFLPIQVIAAALVGVLVYGRRGILEGLLVVVTIFFASFVVVLLFSVIWSVIDNGSKALSWQFLSQNNYYIKPNTSLEYGGVGHAIIGSLLIVGTSTLVTVPMGLATAVYLTETQGKTKNLIRTLLQAMSGLPSVVSGLFIYAAFIASGLTSYAGWTGSLALIPLMLPTVARVSEEALRLVPQELRNGALALGAPAWRAFMLVTLPAARSGMVTAVLLGIARVIGETAPLVLTTFAADRTNLNLFGGAMASLPTYLFGFISMGFDESIQRAWGAALVIMVLVAILFTTARLASRTRSKARK